MITILADDITGAAEIAGVCLRCGISVSFGVNTIPTEATHARVIATDSRSMTETDARALHRLLAQELGKLPSDQVFKKTDSVLRGHVVAELDEWLTALGFEDAVLQPSNPATGRTISNGHYFIEGLPLHQTPFNQDTDFPALTSSVESLLNRQNDSRPSLQKGNNIRTPDCTTEEELKHSVSNQPDVLHAGSAAFFTAWLEVVHHLLPHPKLHTFDLLQGRFLMVSGSKHAQSEQFMLASKKKGLAVAEFPENLLQEKLQDEHLVDWANNQSEFWGRTGQILITQGFRKVDFPHCGEILKRRLAEAVHQILQNWNVGEILLEGGATAFALLELEGWTSLTPIQEFSPGIVRMAVSGKSNLFLTLKPGSYPWPSWDSNHLESYNSSKNTY